MSKKEERLVKSNSDAPAVNEGKKEKAPRKKLTGSLISICLGGVMWAYAFFSDLIEQIKTLYNAQFGATSSVSSSDFVLGGDSVAIGSKPTLIIVLLMALASLLIIAGLISLFTRIIKNLSR